MVLYGLYLSLWMVIGISVFDFWIPLICEGDEQECVSALARDLQVNVCILATAAACEVWQQSRLRHGL